MSITVRPASILEFMLHPRHREDIEYQADLKRSYTHVASTLIRVADAESDASAACDTQLSDTANSTASTDAERTAADADLTTSTDTDHTEADADLTMMVRTRFKMWDASDPEQAAFWDEVFFSWITTMLEKILRALENHNNTAPEGHKVTLGSLAVETEQATVTFRGTLTGMSCLTFMGDKIAEVHDQLYQPGAANQVFTFEVPEETTDDTAAEDAQSVEAAEDQATQVAQEAQPAQTHSETHAENQE